jgi:hypothetical protein
VSSIVATYTPVFGCDASRSRRVGPLPATIFRLAITESVELCHGGRTQPLHSAEATVSSDDYQIVSIQPRRTSLDRYPHQDTHHQNCSARASDQVIRAVVTTGWPACCPMRCDRSYRFRFVRLRAISTNAQPTSVPPPRDTVPCFMATRVRCRHVGNQSELKK